MLRQMEERKKKKTIINKNKSPGHIPRNNANKRESKQMGPGSAKKKRNICYMYIYIYVTHRHTHSRGPAHTNFRVTSRSPYIFSFPVLSSPLCRDHDKMCTFTQNQWTRRVRIYVRLRACVCAWVWVCVCCARAQCKSRPRVWGDIDSGRRGWFLAVFQGKRWSPSLGQNVSHAKGAPSNRALKR